MGRTAPSLWILGSSNYGAQLAAHLGLPYAFAYFFSDGVGVEQALDIYRSQFRPSPFLSHPQATICVSALVCDSEAEAARQFQTRARWRMDRNKGLAGPLLSPEEALLGLSAAQLHEMDALRAQALIGTPVQARAKLQALATSLSLEELVVCTWTHDPAVQLRSFELLAQAFNMTQQQGLKQAA
jgi:luciferase family oxidoreductase group 1